jgi:hypothetical protein
MTSLQSDLGVDYSQGLWNVTLSVNDTTDEILPVCAIGQLSDTLTPPRMVQLLFRRRWQLQGPVQLRLSLPWRRRLD